MFVSMTNPLKMTDNQYETMKERLTRLFNAEKVKPAADNARKEIIYSVYVRQEIPRGDVQSKLYSAANGLSPKEEFFFDERNKRYVITFDEPSLAKVIR